MPFLSDSDRSALLQLARLAVTDAVLHRQIVADIPQGGILSERRGVFVTLHIAARLRGCIGLVDPEEPLADSVVRCAASAALQDPRFSPLRPDELRDLQIEISLLSRPVPIRLDQIEIGTHGLLISREQRRGLLLPQVAVEHHFTVEQFLAETSRKAQLPPDSWRDPGTSVLGFTCEVFSDLLAAPRSPGGPKVT